MSKCKWESHVEPKLVLVEAWARDGLKLEQIAHNLGIADSTLRKYRDTYPALAAALARGREICDVEVENALHRKALGYTAKVLKHYKLKRVEYDPDTGKRVLEVEELKEVYDEVHVPADTEAQKWWLSNRDKAGKWRYRPDAAAPEGDQQTGVVELGAQADDPQPPEELIEQMQAEAEEAVVPSG